jgi:hypothetical protein
MRRKPVFIHIPKTAGTFVRAALERKYATLGCAYPSSPFNPLGRMTSDERALFAAADAVIGHETLHAFETLFHGEAVYYTIMRNPVDRMISYYNHAMSYFEHYKGKPVSLMKFIANLNNPELDNLQLRYLSGKPLGQTPTADDIPRVAERIAQGTLVVGIQERMVETLSRLDIFLGARADPSRRENVSVYGFSRQSFTPDEIEAIRARSRLDMQLYSIALKHFDDTSPAH